MKKKNKKSMSLAEEFKIEAKLIMTKKHFDGGVRIDIPLRKPVALAMLLLDIAPREAVMCEEFGGECCCPDRDEPNRLPCY